MAIDKNKISALSQLSDSEFAEIIRKAMLGAGCSEGQARSAMASAPLLKKKLSAANDREINSIVSFIGEKTATDILSSLDGNKK